MITSEELFHRFPHFREGELSKLRAHLVSEKHLIRVAQNLELGHYLRLGRGEEKSGGRNKTALLVDALEAVMGACISTAEWRRYGAWFCSIFWRRSWNGSRGTGSSLPLTDYKSALQEKLQAIGRPQPAMFW